MYKALCLKSTDFYPRPPGGGRPTCKSHSYLAQQISIHALRVEGDMPSIGRVIR